MEKQYRTGYIKAIEESEYKISGIASTPSVDRDGDVVDPMGMDTASFEKNPQLLWSHNPYELPIGTVTRIVKKPNGIFFDAVFAVEDNPFAKQVFNMMAKGFLNAFSIGFMPEEFDGNVIKAAELFEISVVNIPANAEALVERSFKEFQADEQLRWLKAQGVATKDDFNAFRKEVAENIDKKAADLEKKLTKKQAQKPTIKTVVKQAVAPKVTTNQVKLKLLKSITK